MNESEAIYRAGKAIGRLDQILSCPDTLSLIEPWFLRSEALHIAAAEKRKSDAMRLASLIEDAQNFDLVESADRTALDLFKALTFTRGWGKDDPTAEQVKRLWEIADTSNTKRRDESREWRLERDSAAVAQEIQVLLASPSPWTAAEAVRRVWVNGGMEGSGKRIALLAARHIVSTGFKAPHARAGVAHGLHIDTDRTLGLIEVPEEFAGAFFEAVAISAEKTFDAALRLTRLSDEFLARCKPTRTSAKTPQAIRVLLSHPVITAPFLASQIGISMRGAYGVLERLEEAGCVTKVSQGAKNSTYVCSKALTA